MYHFDPYNVLLLLLQIYRATYDWFCGPGSHILKFLKGMVQPKNLNSSLFTEPHVNPSRYDFFFCRTLNILRKASFFVHILEVCLVINCYHCTEKSQSGLERHNDESFYFWVIYPFKYEIEMCSVYTFSFIYMVLNFLYEMYILWRAKC